MRWGINIKMRNYTKLEKFLGISGVLLIASIFTMNSMLLTSALTLFVIAVILNVNKTFSKHILFDVEEITSKKAENCFKNKKYGASIVNFMVFPILMIGLLFAAIQLIVMWISVLK